MKRNRKQMPFGFSEIEWPLESIPYGETIYPLIIDSTNPGYIRDFEDFMLEKVERQQMHARDILKATLNIVGPDPSKN